MELIFPVKGLNVGIPATKQPTGTTRSANNVRLFWDGKAVGGQRPGCSKRYTQQISSTASPIVAMCSVSVVD